MLYQVLCDTLNFQGRFAEALAACSSPWRFAASATATASMARCTMRLHGGERGRTAAGGRENVPRGAAVPGSGWARFVSITDSRLGMLRLRQGDLEEGERLLREAEPFLRGKGEPMIEIVPVLYARAFAEDVRGRYPEAVRLMSEALDLVTRRRVAFMEPDNLTLQLAAYEALAGDCGALSRLRGVEDACHPLPRWTGSSTTCSQGLSRPVVARRPRPSVTCAPLSPPRRRR